MWGGRGKRLRARGDTTGWCGVRRDTRGRRGATRGRRGPRGEGNGGGGVGGWLGVPPRSPRRRGPAGPAQTAPGSPHPGGTARAPAATSASWSCRTRRRRRDTAPMGATASPPIHPTTPRPPHLQPPPPPHKGGGLRLAAAHLQQGVAGVLLEEGPGSFVPPRVRRAHLHLQLPQLLQAHGQIPPHGHQTLQVIQARVVVPVLLRPRTEEEE